MSNNGTDKPVPDNVKQGLMPKVKLEDRIDALNHESNRNATIRKKEADIISKKESKQ